VAIAIAGIALVGSVVIVAVTQLRAAWRARMTGSREAAHRALAEQAVEAHAHTAAGLEQIAGDYDRGGSLFRKDDDVVRMRHINQELVGRRRSAPGPSGCRVSWTTSCKPRTPGTIELQGETAVGRAFTSEPARFGDGRSQLNYAVYHDQRTPEGWKFTELVYEVRYRDTTPLAGAAPRQPPRRSEQS
jgi:hypothetical protein